MGGTALSATANSLLRTTVLVELFGAERIGEARSRLSVLFTMTNAATPVMIGVAIAAGVGPAPMLAATSLLLLLAAALALACGHAPDR